MLTERRIWLVALILFLIAAAAGAFLRFGFWLGLPWGLQLGDVRHAHSHLMFFGWVTPVLMLLLLRQQGGPLPRWLFVFTFLAAISSFVPFLLSGYGMMTVFGQLLPLSMITSGISGIPWYAFSIIYLLRSRKRKTSPLGVAATMMLLLSTVGVAALAYSGMQHLGPVAIAASASFFLDMFAEGWFGLALISVAYGLIPAVRIPLPGLWLMVAGLAVRGLADWGVALGTQGLLPVTYIASFIAGVGLLVLIWPPLRGIKPGLWYVPFLLLAMKAVVDILTAIPAYSLWSDAAGLRVFYLHAYLLGAISVGLIASARSALGSAAFPRPWVFVGAAAIMTACLLPLSGVWPPALSGIWVLPAAAWTSLLPIFAVLLQGVRRSKTTNK